MNRENLLKALKLYPEFKCYIQTMRDHYRREHAINCLNTLREIMLAEIDDLPSLEYFIRAEIYDDPVRQLREIKVIQAQHPYEKIEFKREGD